LNLIFTLLPCGIASTSRFCHFTTYIYWQRMKQSLN
jgi:hypothetical protein